MRRTFCRSGCFVAGTFFIWDGFSWDVLRLAGHVFGTFCSWFLFNCEAMTWDVVDVPFYRDPCEDPLTLHDNYSRL